MSTAVTGPLRCPITDSIIISFTVLTKNQFNFNHFSTLRLFPPPVLNRESYASVLHLATQVSISRVINRFLLLSSNGNGIVKLVEWCMDVDSIPSSVDPFIHRTGVVMRPSA